MNKLVLYALVYIFSGSVVYASENAYKQLLEEEFFQAGYEPGISRMLAGENVYEYLKFVQTYLLAGYDTDTAKGLAFADLREHLVAENFVVDSLTQGNPQDMLDNTYVDFSLTTQKVLLNKNIARHRDTLGPIVAHIKSIPQESDVHVLDSHVPQWMATLDAIGNDLDIDNPDLSIEQMSTILLEKSDSYKCYAGQSVSLDELKGYIQATLASVSGDPSVQRMYSRIVSLTQRLCDERREESYLKHLYDSISENYKTNGGCFQGVRNRGCIRYVSLLHGLMGQ